MNPISSVDQVISQIQTHKIIAIARGVRQDALLSLADALYAGGIRLLEVTFNASKPGTFADTATCIAALCERFGDRLCIGAGTVLDVRRVELAHRAGARYIVSPDGNRGVIERTKALCMASLPGALTPTEVAAAHSYGADMVKLFPASTMGSAYLRAIRAPLSHVPIVAVGGIHAANAAEYLAAGAVAVGVGGKLADLSLIEQGRYDEITRVAEALCKAAVR